MASRSTLDPYGGLTIPVDKLIGDAFPKVEIVADHIDEVNYLVQNMEAIVLVAQGFVNELTVLATGTALAIGTELSIPYPAAVTTEKLRGFDVLLVGSTGEVHLPGEHYSAKIVGTALKVTLLTGAPPELVGGEVRWRMSYGI